MNCFYLYFNLKRLEINNIKHMEMSIQTFQSQQQKCWIFVSVFRRSLKSNNAWMCHDLSIFRVVDNELCPILLKIKLSRTLNQGSTDHQPKPTCSNLLSWQYNLIQYQHFLLLRQHHNRWHKNDIYRNILSNDVTERQNDHQPRFQDHSKSTDREINWNLLDLFCQNLLLKNRFLFDILYHWKYQLPCSLSSEMKFYLMCESYTKSGQVSGLEFHWTVQKAESERSYIKLDGPKNKTGR